MSSDELKTNIGLEKYYSIIYQLGTCKQNFRIRKKREEIIQDFLSSNDPYLLYLAGCNWNDFWFDERITKSIVKNKEAKFLYYAGLDWKARRFSKEIVEALVETNNKKYIDMALQNWNKTRRKILEKCIMEYNASAIKKEKQNKRKKQIYKE
ncbi:MAG: hypothetical protein ACP5OZ_03470 [Candidatus Woesearchaeota archaeon]